MSEGGLNPPGREEKALENYFILLSNLSHDKARDSLEKEKEGGKGMVSRWSQFVNTLQQLATAEKQYLAAGFLQQRGFLRKDAPAKTVYEHILTDCIRLAGGDQKLLNHPRTHPHPHQQQQQQISLQQQQKLAQPDLVARVIQQQQKLAQPDLVARLCCEVCVVVRGRLLAMEEYEKLANAAPKLPPFKEISSVIRGVEVSCKHLNCQIMEPWRRVFLLEMGILQDFVSSSASMQIWDFFTSLMNLQSGSNRLQEWTEATQNRETKKLSFASSLLWGVGSAAEPHLMSWLGRVKSTLLAKFSLYFYQILAKQSSPGDMRGLTSKLLTDYASRLTGFQRRSDAYAVCIVFDASNLPNFQGPGYHYKENVTNMPCGLDKFPSVFSHPSQPTQQWPNIVMIITDRNIELATDRVVYFYDGGVAMTFFLQQLEPRFTLVAIYEGKRAERDSTINSFMAETSHQLRCSKVFSSLKPGSK